MIEIFHVKKFPQGSTRILKIQIATIYLNLLFRVNGGRVEYSTLRCKLILRMISATHPYIIDSWRKPVSKQTRLGFSVQYSCQTKCPQWVRLLTGSSSRRTYQKSGNSCQSFSKHQNFNLERSEWFQAVFLSVESTCSSAGRAVIYGHCG